MTYLPARIFCERCLAELEPSLECGPEGELVSWTLVRVDIDDRPLERPVAYGLVRLDGADTVLLHRLLDAGEPTIGERVRAVFASLREGSMLDVEGFAPSGDGSVP